MNIVLGIKGIRKNIRNKTKIKSLIYKRSGKTIKIKRIRGRI